LEEVVKTVAEAFESFRTNLETTASEDSAASRRQQQIRKNLDDSDLDIVDDFLTGSYRRQTKTKPLRDVDIIVVLGDRSYLDRHPATVLKDVRAVLAPIYGDDRVTTDRRAVRVDFGVAVVDDVAGDVMSFDVVPALADGSNYLIPDDRLGEWISTNPKKHAELATAANDLYDGNWKPLLKMLKKWNDNQGQPIVPSFLLETMALDILTGGWAGPYPFELRMFFSTAAIRIDETWPDPAHVGPSVSEVLEGDIGLREAARERLLEGERACTRALQLERGGNVGGALSEWRDIFGPLFPAS
jgi:hypothetical protein